MKPIPEHGETVTLTRNEYAEMLMRSNDKDDEIERLCEIIRKYELVDDYVCSGAVPPSVSYTPSLGKKDD